MSSTTPGFQTLKQRPLSLANASHKAHVRGSRCTSVAPTIFFFSRVFFRNIHACPCARRFGLRQLRESPRPQTARMGRRLWAGVACQRASARSSCRAGSGPPALHAPPGGSSRSDAAKARCAARQQSGEKQAPPLRALSLASEGGGFGSPPAAYFHPEHHLERTRNAVVNGMSQGLQVA